jgi:hypothetical protein
VQRRGILWAVGKGSGARERTRAPEVKGRFHMISYDPLRIRRHDLARACDYWLDGMYHLIDHSRQELIDEVNRDYIEEAVCILETSIPEEYHRKLDECDITRMVIALVLYRLEGWDVIDDYLSELADELGFFPER